MTLAVRRLTGQALAAALEDIARLRITVFRDWPYLYDGDLAYERTYMQPYVESAQAIVVGAFDGDRLVGACTGTPLSDHKADFAAAYAETGIDLDTVFYCAESVLLSGYRGRGAGHRFFDAREAHARDLGFSATCFCAVMRETSDPRRPADYAPLDPFWRKRGYAPLPGVTARFDWREVGATEESAHDLQFWMRSLPGG
ncbi:GNAT family N-acetyltransferase [uncultured Roseobacter sp.]|uniref:GNAT family N-acetyltransferase n=1 Tax=uncultured Roseobacter sp. TaxID=114847 RepID=UPI0026229F09|nr:GNAT family N-acetyltransferase [uncultured Roseobacter sp.]